MRRTIRAVLSIHQGKVQMHHWFQIDDILASADDKVPKILRLDVVDNIKRGLRWCLLQLPVLEELLTDLSKREVLPYRECRHLG